MPGWGRGGRVLQCMDEAEGSHFCYVFDPILLRYGVLVSLYMSCQSCSVDQASI